MALNMGTFEALDQQEMYDVDGGGGKIRDWAIGFFVDKAISFLVYCSKNYPDPYREHHQ